MLRPLLLLRRLLRCERGATVLLAALVGSLVMGGLLTAFDVARLHLTKTRLQNAVDAAALAAARDVASTTLATDARQVFHANYVPGYLGTRPDTGVLADGFALRPGRCDAAPVEAAAPTFDTDAAVMELCIEAVVQLDSVLAPLVGAVAPDLFRIRASATTLRRTHGMELALVLDNTGSMRSGGRMDALKAAARLLVDILYNGKTTVPNLRVALVPYTATVNIGRQHAAWLDPASFATLVPSGVPVPATLADLFAPTVWKGCVLAREDGADRTAATPVAAPLTPFWYPPSPVASCTPFPRTQGKRNCWPDAKGAVDERNAAQNDGYGPNLGCGPPIVPLTADYGVVSDAIDDMAPWHRGGTMANVGLVWGWRTLAPDWRGLWRRADGMPIEADRPFDYDHPSTTKVIVLMTDGNNEWYQDDFTAYRFRADDLLGVNLSASQARNAINARMTEACDALKAAGVVIYTVTFGGSLNSATRTLYEDCASDPLQNPVFPGQKYFHAPAGEDLRDAFAGIAGQLSELRLLR